MAINRLDVERRIAEIRQQIAALQAELVELEMADAVMRKLEGIGPDPAALEQAMIVPSTSPGSGDLYRATTVDAALIVMAAQPEIEWYYADVATVARTRGYKPRPGSSDRAFKDTFRRKMENVGDVFVSCGNRSGRFKLSWDATIEHAIGIMRGKKAEWSAAEVAAVAKRHGYLPEQRDLTTLFRMAMEANPETFEQIGNSGVFRLANADPDSNPQV